MSVGTVGVHRYVGHHTHLRETVFNGPNGTQIQPVGISAFGGVPVFFGFGQVRKYIKGPDTEVNALGNFVHQQIGRETINTRHRSHLRAEFLAFHHKQGQNKIVYCQAGFLHQVPNHHRGAVPPGAFYYVH